MPPRPRRTSRTRSGGARRRLVWAQYQTSQAFTANAQWATLDLLSTYKAATGASAAGVTIMRTHLVVCPRAVQAADSIYIGLAIYDLDDITAATTVNALVPNPHDNPYIDWMYSRRLVADTNVTMAGASGSGSYAGLHLDLRAKRRMHQVQMAYGLCIYQDAVGTVAKTYDIFARTLLAMP
jgi:hypothetical protein